jgi:dTDP-4-dehydrorhamnose reductase|tara:strand:- start:17 stop:730 length:714 start_codon:yes stop_codon:yes gene_type:complete
MSNKNKIIVTGGNGRFGKILHQHVGSNYLFPKKNELDILKISSIINYLKKIKPKYLIHLAGLSRPMVLHENDIKKSISLNIIGTANIVIACEKFNIKLIYFSSSYVYPGVKGNYKETDALLPINNYAWSKLGAESAVQMYKNSLILRVSMTEKPFVHKKAYADMITNFIFHEDFIKIFKKVLNKKGILNIGGKTDTVYNFAKKHKKNVKKIYLKKNLFPKMPKNSSMSLTKLKKLIK